MPPPLSCYCLEGEDTERNDVETDGLLGYRDDEVRVSRMWEGRGELLPSISVAFKHCVLRVACGGCVLCGYAAWQKLSIFTATEHHRIKGEARHTLSVAVCEAVYHKFVLRNHHMQLAMFKRNGN